MSTWKPAKSEESPLKLAIYDYLRNNAPLVYLKKNKNNQLSLGCITEVMSTGTNITIDLNITPSNINNDFPNRRTVFYIISGHATEKYLGYTVKGSLIIDIDTLSFLRADVILNKI